MFLLPKDHWEVKKTPQKGRGVFAQQDIQAGTIVGDYLGKVISANDELTYEEKYGFYIMYYNDQKSIFPYLKKDGVHLINHSCTPNTGFYTYKGHTIYFAIRKIFKDEEITTSYQLNPLDKDCAPCTHICQCGTFICSQTMHLPKEKYEKWDEFDDEITKMTKKERIKVGTDLSPLADYPNHIPDYTAYNLFGSDKKPAVSYSDTSMPLISEVRQRIRQTGRYAYFPKLNITVYGVMDGFLITKL